MDDATATPQQQPGLPEPGRLEAAQPELEQRDLDASALRALAHPVRMAVFDILSQYGPQTATSLGRRLGESSGAMSYHLRMLARHGLIVELPERGNARERWWGRPRGAVSLGAPDALTSPAGRAAAQIVTSEFYQRRHEQVLRFLHRATESDVQPFALLSASTVHLTPEQFEEFVGEVHGVIDRWVCEHRGQEGENVRPYSIRADMFPLPDLTDDDPV